MVTTQIRGGVVLTTKALGKRRAISTSKIRNRTVMTKNRREKGTRVLELGSKPHSNGVLFSRLNRVF